VAVSSCCSASYAVGQRWRWYVTMVEVSTLLQQTRNAALKAGLSRHVFFAGRREAPTRASAFTQNREWELTKRKTGHEKFAEHV